MPSGRLSEKIVIAGASSLLGAELKSLLEESRFAEADLRLLDEEIAAGTLTEAAGEAAIIQKVEEGSFERAKFVFFAGSPHFTKANLAAARGSGARVIDLSGGSLGLGETRLWHARADLPRDASATLAVLSAPGAVAVSLLDALVPLGLSRLGLLFLRPVSEAGRGGIEELESQTSHLLSFQSIGHPVFGTQVAFNLLNRYGESSVESLSAVRERIRQELSGFNGKRLSPAIEVVHAPVFYGYTFAVLAETEPAVSRDALLAACREAGFLVEQKQQEPLGNVDAVDEFVRLALPESGLPPSGSWWIWGAVDNIKMPAASAVKLAEKLDA